MFLIRSIIVVLVTGMTLGAAAQPLRFGSGVFGGVNLAQVDGDDMQGYDKPGLNLGMRGMAFILPKLEFHTELAYNQKGSQSKDFDKSTNKGRKLFVDFVAINALVVVNDWFHPIKEYYRLQVHGGISTGRMVRFQVIDPGSDPRRVPLKELSYYFNGIDFSMIFGAHLKFTQKTGISFRYSRSMNKLLDADLVQPLFERKTINSMKGYFLSLDFFYHF
ncbi:MAG: outer membrane beta-barrel protein [Saprospiraceae bacterium]|nr:outer membrane beta-barrel protein [Saprospiraceae bacterium]